jgi:hypothetical protein
VRAPASTDKEWIRQDFRQVTRKPGTFEAEVESDGSHADCFDAVKLALHGLNVARGPPKCTPYNSAPLAKGWKRPLDESHFNLFVNAPTLNARKA